MMQKPCSQFTVHGSQLIKQMFVRHSNFVIRHFNHYLPHGRGLDRVGVWESQFVKIALIQLLITLFALGAPLAANQDKDKEEPRTVKLQIVPAVEAYPALKYKLLPHILDQKPGNAAQFYYRAVSMMPEKYNEEFREKIDDWRDIPIDKLPLDEVREGIRQLPDALLREVRTASIRETCHWEMPLEDGFAMLLPGLGEFRNIAKVLALKTRLEFTEGKFDEAIKTLQTGFALGRDVGKGPTIIQGLVGIAIGSLMLDEVEQFVQAPGSPNLYWALMSLPKPYVDMQKAMELESIILPMQFPLLKEIETTRLSVEQTRNLWNNILGLLGEFGGDSQPNLQTSALATGIVMFMYPEAKKKLIEQGYTPEQVEAMPTGQVALIHQYKMYQNFMQEMYKWFHVPYWQAKPGLDQATDELKSYSKSLRNQMLGAPFVMLMPALNRVHYIQARTQRRIAALCCVEAIRMYAAENDDKLPSRLQEFTQVPLPVDPMTGEDFSYRMENGSAILEGPAPPNESPDQGIRYEITVRKGK